MLVEILYWSYFALATIIYFIIFSDNDNFLKVLIGFFFGGALLLMIPVLPFFIIRLIPEEYLSLRETISIIYFSFLIFLCCRFLFASLKKNEDKTSSNKKESEFYVSRVEKISQQIQKTNTNIYDDIIIKKSLDLKETKQVNVITKEELQKELIIKVETSEFKSELKEELPLSKVETFVDYDSSKAETTISYPVCRFPKKGTVVRSFRLGKTKRRGIKEELFQKSIELYFGKDFTVLGNARLNTGKETRPFEPDIAIIDQSNTNLRIDIEIDEPYAGITRQPTHCKGEDTIRDIYFVDRGWIVIRFSEYQVHTQENDCLRFIAETIKSVIPNYDIPKELVNQVSLQAEKLWDVVQAQKWEKKKYREEYLNHTFQATEEQTETIERDFDEQELKEEKLVKPTLIGKVDNKKSIGYNDKNTHPRDPRIKFYPQPHIYTIDNTPAPSASTIIGKFFPEFDSPHWSRKKAIDKLQVNNQELTELNIQRMADLIAKEWRERGEKSAQEGTYLHEQIENFYLEQEYNRTEEFHLFENFVNENNHIKPYRTEWRIFDEQYHIAGTIDLISENVNGYEMYDWKRSKKVVNSFNGQPIKNNQWQKGVGQLSDTEDTSYNRYCLQQSLYKYILEKNYGIKISNMYLIVLYPEYNNYFKVEVPYLKDKVEYILKTL